MEVLQTEVAEQLAGLSQEYKELYAKRAGLNKDARAVTSLLNGIQDEVSDIFAENEIVELDGVGKEVQTKPRVSCKDALSLFQNAQIWAGSENSEIKLLGDMVLNHLTYIKPQTKLSLDTK